MLGLPFPPKLVSSRAPLGPLDVALFIGAGGLLLLWRSGPYSGRESP